MKRFGLFAASALLGLFTATNGFFSATSAQEQETTEKPFGIGSKAPELDVEHWVSDGHGAFKPVTKFEEGHIYVVEFWATWCGPCIASMPHLAETQTKYKDKKVQLISISDEDLETVNAFLEQAVPEKEGVTYRELTKSYCLTADPDRSVYKGFMEAANQNGIPTAFIVGKKGLIEWIGHPMEMDEPLEQILADKWDLQVAAKKFEEDMKAQQKLMAIFGKLNDGDFAAGLKMLDEVIAGEKNGEMANQLRGLKLNVLLQSGAFSEAEVIPVAKELLTQIGAEPMNVTNMARMVATKAGEGFFADKAFLSEVAAIAEKTAATVEDESQNWIIWDTAGQLYFHAGNLEKAIETQKKAVANPNSVQAPEVAEFLKKLESIKP